MSTATVVSKDGTTIAYERIGSGPAVVLVDGAMANRELGPCRAVAQELSSDHTVYFYDRRGRGESGDTAPYAPEREIEDLEAIVAEAGEPVTICAFSSGVPLSLAAVKAGLAVKRLALYEFPMVVDDSRPPAPPEYQRTINEMIDAGKPGDAVKYFMRRGVRLPAALVALFPIMPDWSKLKQVGHTLAYDMHFMGDALDGNPIPAGRYDWVGVPTAVYAGSKSPAWMRNANAALAESIPGASLTVLPGQTHMVKAKLFVPTLREFLTA
ncbi:alpha/beta fold hydrolase [Nocardia sp. GAS34]|uniref:alpha/beta fold hydrolase n=1 Tax=unclassified Nocardia TaxID=2637762 RepID=UPI003D21D376